MIWSQGTYKYDGTNVYLAFSIAMRWKQLIFYAELWGLPIHYPYMHLDIIPVSLIIILCAFHFKRFSCNSY